MSTLLLAGSALAASHPPCALCHRHFSTEEFPEDLKLQTKALSARTMHKNDMPMVVMYVIPPPPCRWFALS